MGHSARYRIARGLQRVIGTALGLGVMAAVSLLEPEAWLMVLMIALFQVVAELFAVRQYMIAMIAITPLALLSTVLSSSATGVSPDIPALLFDRVVETAIGAAVGIVFVMAPWFWRRARQVRGGAPQPGR